MERSEKPAEPVWTPTGRVVEFDSASARLRFDFWLGGDGQSRGSIATASAATAATAVAAASTAAATAAVAAAATTPRFAGLGLVNCEATAVDFLVVKTLDGRLGLGLAAHFHKAKALAPTRVAILDDLRSPRSRTRRTIAPDRRRRPGRPSSRHTISCPRPSSRNEVATRRKSLGSDPIGADAGGPSGGKARGAARAESLRIDVAGSFGFQPDHYKHSPPARDRDFRPFREPRETFGSEPSRPLAPWPVRTADSSGANAPSRGRRLRVSPRPASSRRGRIAA